MELLDDQVSSAGLPLAMPNPSSTTTVVITVEEPGVNEPAAPPGMELNVLSPPGAPLAVIEISDDEPADNAGSSKSMGIARPIAMRTRQPYAAAPNAGSGVNVRARSRTLKKRSPGVSREGGWLKLHPQNCLKPWRGNLPPFQVVIASYLNKM